MACEIVKMKDGTTLFVNVVDGEKLNKRDLRAVEEYVAFVRKRRAKALKKAAKTGRRVKI